ncbi:transposase [Streptomyces sp. NPDC046977]|uniref:transposase n=1 Tax=Streptomyces sp. NPDC046977 TaxID=3154703 RepID=UPI0033E23544
MSLIRDAWRPDERPAGWTGAAVADRQQGWSAVWARRQLTDDIRFRVCTGIPQRDVPEQYGPWERVYDPFRRRQRDGTWQRIFTELQAPANAKDLEHLGPNVDSTVRRAHHQHAAMVELPPHPAEVTDASYCGGNARSYRLAAWRPVQRRRSQLPISPIAVRRAADAMHCVRDAGWPTALANDQSASARSSHQMATDQTWRTERGLSLIA